MSGKSRQQRTKGNVKPASSARTAELLAAQSTPVSAGIAGLGGATLFGFAPSGAVLSDQTDEINSEVNPEITLILKKLSKRDAATKLKALQELKQLCQFLDCEDVVRALPYWPRLFNKLAVDVDRRVREATHCANEQICVKAGRQLAAHLRLIMPCWLCTMSDPHPPAARASQAAFTATLTSDSKRADALVYCKDAIFNYITENLFEHSPSTLSDPKSTPSEDMQSKYERVVATSFLAIGCLLQQLSAKQKTGFYDQLDALFGQSKLWKYGKSKVPSIRVAVYRMITASCQHIPEKVVSHVGAVCPLALVAVGETERMVCPAAWEAALHVMTTIEGCWSHVNVRKAVLPRIWSVLKESGAGAADLIYPNLLPLLGQLPEAIVADGGFHVEFFSNMRTGMESATLEQSSVASEAVVTSFFECLRFALLYGKAQQSDTSLGLSDDIRKCLLCDHMLKVLEVSLFESIASHLSSSQLVYASFASLLGYLLKRSQLLPSEFWTNLRLLAMRAVDELGGKDLQTSDRTMSFLKELAVVCENLDIGDSGDAMPLYQMLREAFMNCRQLAFSQESNNHLSLLAFVFRSVSDPAFLLQPEDEESGNAVTDFVDSDLVPHLKQSPIDSTRHDTSVEILFVLLSHTDEDHICRTLNSLIQARDGSPIILAAAAMVKSASASSVLVGAIRRWFRDTSISERMVASAKQLTQRAGGSEQSDHEEEMRSVMNKQWKLLELAISSCDPLVTRDCRIQVLTLIGQFLDELVICEQVQDTVRHTTSEVMHLLQVRFELSSEWLEDSDFDLASKVFLLLGCEWSNAGSVWKAAMRAVQCLGREEELLKQLCTWVKAKVLHCSSTDLATSLAHQASQLFQQGTETSVISAAVKGLLPTVQEWVEWREGYKHWSIACQPFVTGAVNISSLHRSDLLNKRQESRGWSEDHRHVCWSVFVAQLVLGGSNMEEAVQPSDPIELSLIQLDELKNISLELLWQLQVNMNGDSGRDKSTGNLIHILQTSIMKLLSHVGQVQQADDLFYMATHRSSEVGGIWAQVLGSLFSYFLSEEMPFDSAMHTSFMCSKRKLSACELQSIQMLAVSLEEASSADTVHSAITSTAEILSQQLLTSPVAMNLFSTSAGTQLDACLSGLCLVNCSLRLGCKFESVDCRPIASQIIDQLIVWRDSSDAFLFDSSVSSASPVQLGFNTETCRFLSWAVRHFPSVLVDKHWDFIFCGLVSWLQTCSEGFGDDQLMLSLGYQALAYQVLLLLARVSECFGSAADDSSIPSKIASDWRDFFSEASYAIVLPMFMSMAERPVLTESSYSNQLLMRAVSQAIIQCPAQCFEGNLIGSGQVVAAAPAYESYSVGLHENLKKFSSLLLSESLCVQAGAYECLKKFVPSVVRLDTIALQSPDDSSNSSDQRETDVAKVSLPEGLLAVSSDAALLIADVLGVPETGTSCSKSGGSSQLQLESGCVAYCLCWLLILDCFQNANHELRVHYSRSAKAEGRLSSLMRLLFALMPDGQKSAQSALQGDCRPSSWNSPPATGHTNFWQWVQQQTNKAADLVERLSCSVYFRCLRQLPALVRQWYSSTDKKTSMTVEKFTSQFISPLLTQQELSAIQECKYRSDNMQIRVRLSAREVVATYTISDVSIELIVALTPSHPLSPVKVECGRRVGVPQAQWRNWMLQLTTFLSHQNGTILDGLVLWKDNLDKKFSGLDDCMICFSVIHGSNCSIPTLQCKTCKKKFHSACLYKWFSTSNVSSCPLCRNLF